MTDLTPKRKTIRRSKWSSLVTTIGRGYDLVLLDGLRSGKILYSLVLDQKDWFIRTRGITKSDYAILRCCKFLDYSRMTKTFTIRDPLVVGYLAKMGVKPTVIRNSITLPSTTSSKD